MKFFFLLLVIALASVADPADLRAEASGGRTEAGGAFMSSYRPWPSAVTSGPAAQTGQHHRLPYWAPFSPETEDADILAAFVANGTFPD